MSAAIEVKGLSFAYGEREILKDIHLTVQRGETLVLTGDSGCGKTTLCRILCGIIPHALPGTVRGDVLLMGENIAGKTLAECALKIGMVFQDADQQLICTTVEDELAFAPENLCVPAEEIRRQVDEMLRCFHMEEMRLSNPSRLSGGQKKLLTIAATLMLQPPILVLDEPMNALDAESRALVQQTVRQLQQEGTTLVVIEHDPALYPENARVVRLQEGRL